MDEKLPELYEMQAMIKRAMAKAALKKVQKTSVLPLDFLEKGMLFYFCSKLYLSIFKLNYRCNKILLLLKEVRLQKVYPRLLYLQAYHLSA
jgi:hypothetical protein